jgi:hypothetical protein
VNRAQQREFFQLAAVYLGCRLRAMGGDVTGLEPRKGPLHFILLGMKDYAIEMHLLVRECQVNAIRATAPTASPKPT